jgi:hypothetical protein
MLVRSDDTMHAESLLFDQADRPSVSLVSQRFMDIITLRSLTLMLNLPDPVPCPEFKIASPSSALPRVTDESRAKSNAECFFSFFFKLRYYRRALSTSQLGENADDDDVTLCAD